MALIHFYGCYILQLSLDGSVLQRMLNDNQRWTQVSGGLTRQAPWPPPCERFCLFGIIKIVLVINARFLQEDNCKSVAAN